MWIGAENPGKQTCADAACATEFIWGDGTSDPVAYDASYVTGGLNSDNSFGCVFVDGNSPIVFLPTAPLRTVVFL